MVANIGAFIKKVIKMVDIFREPIQLQIKTNQKFNTLLGGILSLITYVLTISLIASLVELIIKKDKPRINSSTLYVEYAPQINLEKDGIRMGS